MFVLRLCLVLLLSNRVRSQSVSVQFPSFPANTDIGTCTCDLTSNQCDVSCCCDLDCSSGDLQVFGCSSRQNTYTNSRMDQSDNTSTPQYSSIQQDCFKNLSIFSSDTPYVITKMGELVCIDYVRSFTSQFYQQPPNTTIDPSDFTRAFNTLDSVSAPLQAATGLTNYLVGSLVLTNGSSSASQLVTLPVPLFKNTLCSGSLPITYMNDFTSTCRQLVTNATCSGALNAASYTQRLCLVKTPSNLNSNHFATLSVDHALVIIHLGVTCISGILPTSVFGTDCTLALQHLIVTITYSNPTGIVSVQASATNTTATANTLFEQTFTVQFVKDQSTNTNTSRYPGYPQGANIVAGFSSNNSITTISSSVFSLRRAASTGFCDSTVATIPIRFGESIRSSCQYSLSPVVTDVTTDTLNQLASFRATATYIAAYSISDPSNITNDWLPVISCTSDIGSPSSAVCAPGALVNPTDGRIYLRLDIQIEYTKIGSLANPQSVLSGVIFNYQSIVDPVNFPTTSTVVLTTSVTFTEITNTPVVEEGHIPPPNSRLPGDFFYPFASSNARKSVSFLSFFSHAVISAFILMYRYSIGM